MKNVFTRKRLSMLFCCVGIALMGVDLLMTRNVFVHIGELMAASIICLIIALLLDGRSGEDRKKAAPTEGSPENHGAEKKVASKTSAK
ncbi:MAG: hypothetical protein R6V08_06850 [Desulfuromonadales bacterium]